MMTKNELRDLAKNVAEQIATVQGSENRVTYDYVEGVIDTLDMLGIACMWDIKLSGVEDNERLCDVYLHDGEQSVMSRVVYMVDERGKRV